MKYILLSRMEIVGLSSETAYVCFGDIINRETCLKSMAFVAMQ